MGQKISEHRQDWEFLLPLLPNLCCTSSPLAFTEGTIIFFQILKLLSGYLQWSIHNFNRITLYCHRRLSLRLDAYVWLSYFLTALSHRSASLLETHPLTGLITQSLKWCIPYIYNILLHTHCFCMKKSRISLPPVFLQGSFYLDLPLSIAAAGYGSDRPF